MKLYKYIGFDKEEWWHQPAITNELFFSNVGQLRGVNDEEEFAHSWEHSSWFINQHVTEYFRPTYNRIFDNARVLCLSKNHARSCWDAFCPHGGVCYEFEYSPENAIGISKGSIKYSDFKEHNVPEFYLSRIQDVNVRNILLSTARPTAEEHFEVARWFREMNGESNILTAHIHDELTFKKLRAYDKEFEYRFIHIQEPVGSLSLDVRLRNSRLSFHELGLSLKRIYTTDISRAASRINCEDYKIKKTNCVGS